MLEDDESPERSTRNTISPERGQPGRRGGGVPPRAYGPWVVATGPSGRRSEGGPELLEHPGCQLGELLRLDVRGWFLIRKRTPFLFRVLGCDLKCAN